MGLDWNPMGRPKPGHEPEFEAIFRALEGDPQNPARDAWLKRFQSISEPPFATLQAPRVGIDASADEWLAKRIPDSSKLAEAKEQMHGLYVLDLLPPCDGFPRYSNYAASGGQAGYERYTFRAQFLDDAVDVIGENLHADGHQNKLAPELKAYADALEAKVKPWAEKNGVAHLATATKAPDGDPKSPAAIADMLFSAIRWCRFWAERGHGLEPWF